MKIKKGWKITWIALGSLLGLIIVAVAVALWLVFTPSKLTKIVNGLAGDFITCEARFGNVDLTLLSTFPDAGLKIENVVIVNPMEGANSDTLAKIGSLTVGIDVMAFLKEDKVIVHQVMLDEATAHLYINGDGEANFDIFPKSEKEDTSSMALPEVIDLKKIKLTHLNADFVDERDKLSGSADGMDMVLKGSLEQLDGEVDLKMEVYRLIFKQWSDTTLLAARAEGLEVDMGGKKKGDDMNAELKVGGRLFDMEQMDTLNNSKMKASMKDWKADVDADGTTDLLDGRLRMKVDNGTFAMGGKEMINETLQASKKSLLEMDIPFAADLRRMLFSVENQGAVQVDDYGLMVSGSVQMASDSLPMDIHVGLATDGSWQVKPLLAIVPAEYLSWKKGMEVDGKVGFEMTADGTLGAGKMPAVQGKITLDKGSFYASKMLPYRLDKVKGELSTDIYLDKSKESWVKIESLKAHTRETDVSLSGRVDDLLGDMRVDAKVKGMLPLDDVMPMIPKEMKLAAKGDAEVDIKANFKMSELQRQAFDKMKVEGKVNLKDVDVEYDSLRADAKHLDIDLLLPSKQKGKMVDVQLKSGKLNVENGKKMNFDLENATIKVGVNNLLKEELSAAFNIEIGETDAKMDSMVMLLSELKLDGTVRLDSSQQNILKHYNPRFGVTVDNLFLYTPQLPDNMRVTEFDMTYSPALLDIRTAKVKLGHSDCELYGQVESLEDWLEHKAMLKGDLHFTSDYADVDQIMNMFSGMGSDMDSLDAMRVEDAVPPEANPFIVPKDVNVTLHTHIKRSIAFGNALHDVAGTLTVKDGRAVLDQMGFVCKAAAMQLTALYKSQRPGNLFFACDFHLLDIQIDELLDMIPAIDTLVPMLSAFAGNADFHLAGETFMDANYKLKLPTLKGAAAISGKDLVVMDDRNISNIAKLMHFKSWRDKDNKIKIDSLSVEMTCMDDGHGSEVEILPFLLCMGGYKICISGVQNVNLNCNYHLELLKNPLLAKVGVDVKGSLTKPKISLGKVKYADLFRPKYHGVAEQKALEIKHKVREALEANVR